MKQAEDFLQELFEQIEDGQPVESTIQGLPEAEADLVRFVSALGTVAYPTEEEAVVAAQEFEFIEAAKQQFAPAPASKPNDVPLTAVYLQKVKAWLAEFTNPRELAVIGALVLALLIIGNIQRFRTPAEESPLLEEGPGETAVLPGTEINNDPSIDESITVETQPDEPITIAPDDVAEATADIASLTILEPLVPEGENILYLPSIGTALVQTAQTAVIENIVGLVEVQQPNGEWTAVYQNGIISSGKRIRTGAYSQATLTFFDGSEAQLSAESELSIDQLNALQPAQGFRTVVMTQWTGESEHRVAFRNDGGSRYEVKSPTGTGIARGTIFQVMVQPDGMTRYMVTEGKVDVTNANQTVSISGGQLTRFVGDQPPVPAAFLVEGEGEVEAIGTSWTIAGQTFQTNAQTLIIGNPQVGDLVRVEGYLLEGGGQMADRIILQRESLNGRFTLSGEVTQMGATWVVAGQTIAVDDATAVAPTIEMGDVVTVYGRILADGTLLAVTIIEPMAELGIPFELSGVVQQISPNRWLIDGQTIFIAAETRIRNNIAIGTVVTVRGWVVEDGRWVAGTIRPENNPLPTFEFNGFVDQIDPWIVNGIPFDVRRWSIVDPAITIGTEVKVIGVILPNGTRIASSITPIVRQFAERPVIFTGIVTNLEPWIVNGIPLQINNDSLILGDIQIGRRVQVQAIILPNGSWRVLQIRLLNPQFGLGCFILNGRVNVVNGNSIQVSNWPGEIVRNGRISFADDLEIDDFVLIPVCTQWDGTIIIIGDIIITYRPIIIIINDGNNGGGNNVPPGCRVTPKGSIKCTRRSSRRS